MMENYPSNGIGDSLLVFHLLKAEGKIRVYNGDGQRVYIAARPLASLGKEDAPPIEVKTFMPISNQLYCKMSATEQCQPTSGHPNTNNNNQEVNQNHSLLTIHSLAQIQEKQSPSPGSEMSSYEENRTNLIINYLPANMTQEDVRSLFSTVGEVESCKLIRDKQSGQSLGYGFVNYKTLDCADKAIKTFNQLKIQNKTIKVSLARPSSESIKGANVYVCGLPKNYTQLELEALFVGYGDIISSRILTDPATGISKGVGFIRFDRKQEAERAIVEMNGSTPEGATDKITVKFANTPGSKIAAAAAAAAVTTPAVALASYLPALRHALAPNGLPTTGLGPVHHARYSSLYRYSPFDTNPTATNIYSNPATQHYLFNQLAASPYLGSAAQLPQAASAHLPMNSVNQMNGIDMQQVTPGFVATPYPAPSNQSASPNVPTNIQPAWWPYM